MYYNRYQYVSVPDIGREDLCRRKLLYYYYYY
jgi:hypothetical protein